MRESNFAFPAQNRASLCISSQLYDRRALDTTSALPLFNSLSHLTTLSSTSPRIREMIVADGGLERLVRMLRDFCINPPAPEPPTQFFGLLPPPASSPLTPPSATTTHSGPPIHDPKRPFDRAAAYRFSLALQCLVNIGVRGSEPIRARVVQAGTLDVVGCILEAWLTSKGFAVLPSSSASGLPREPREVRQARRLAMMELRAQEHAEQRGLLPHHFQSDPIRRAVDRAPSDDHILPPIDNADNDNDNDTSAPEHSDPDIIMSIPTTVSIPTSRSTSATRTDTEPESDADAEMEDAAAAAAPSSQPHESSVSQHQQPAEQVDMMEQDLQMTMDLLIDGAEDGPGENGGVDLLAAGRNMGMGREMTLGIMRERDRDRDRERERPTTTTTNTQEDSSLTPRATVAPLPDTIATTNPTTPRNQPRHPAPAPTPNTTTPTPAAPHSHVHVHSSHHTRHDAGPYREEDVLLSLQLLAYLSKYPHVRQAFYKPRAVFNPVLKNMHLGGGSESSPSTSGATPNLATSSFFKHLARAKPRPSTSDSSHLLNSTATPSSPPKRATPSLLQSTNIFSLVERFTFRPTPSESLLSHPPPLLPHEIQHWAGVVMRNACRKDEARGGIRQCANVQCGKWESFPREFAKCRRCRKAKYCGKECQSRAWSEGHRFWCSAKEEEDAVAGGLGLGVGVNAGLSRENDEATARHRERVRAQDRFAMPTTAAVNVHAHASFLPSQQGSATGAPALTPAPTAVSPASATSQPGSVPQHHSHAHGHAHIHAPNGGHPTPPPLPQYFFHAAPVPIPIPAPHPSSQYHGRHHPLPQFVRQRVNALQPSTHSYTHTSNNNNNANADTNSNNHHFSSSVVSNSGQTVRPQAYAPSPTQPQGQVQRQPPLFAHPLQSFSIPPQTGPVAPSSNHSTYGNTHHHPYIHVRRVPNNNIMGMAMGLNGDGDGGNGDGIGGGNVRIEPSVSTADLPGMVRSMTDG